MYKFINIWKEIKFFLIEFYLKIESFNLKFIDSSFPRLTFMEIKSLIYEFN